jgi:transcription elongation factor GreA
MDFDEDVTYTIVGSTEVDLAQNKISNESPIGSALIGAKKGQVVEAKIPTGIAKFKILSIKK